MVFELTVLPVLFFLSAFFSGSETVLFSLTGAQRARIRARNPKADARIGRCLNDKALLFSTLLVGNTFVNFAISTIGYRLFRDYIPFGGCIAVPVTTVFLLAFGEITPKRLALKYAERFAPPCSALLLFWRWTLTPFNQFLRFSSRAFAPALERERRALSDAEFLTVLESAAERGDFSNADAEMVEGVLRLSNLRASDEMTPRVDIEGYDVDLDAATLENALRTARHKWLPMFRRSPDTIDRLIDRDTRRIVDPLFVPETLTLDELLQKFADEASPMAIVMDEYGGVAGLITPNDILELIVGPKVFGDPRQDPEITPVGQNKWKIDGWASLDEINRTLNLDLEAGDADRLSGWMQYHAEHILRRKETVTAQGCRATVETLRRRCVTQVVLEVVSRHEKTADEEIIHETDEAVERTEKDLADERARREKAAESDGRGNA